MPSGPAKHTVVNAVHEDDLDAFLVGVGLQETYRSGELRCSACGSELNAVGVGAVRREGNDLVFCCGRSDCIQAFSE